MDHVSYTACSGWFRSIFQFTPNFFVIVKNGIINLLSWLAEAHAVEYSLYFVKIVLIYFYLFYWIDSEFNKDLALDMIDNEFISNHYDESKQKIKK